MFLSVPSLIYLFRAYVLFLFSLKTSANESFSIVFTRDKKGTLAWNWLRKFIFVSRNLPYEKKPQSKFKILFKYLLKVCWNLISGTTGTAAVLSLFIWHHKLQVSILFSFCKCTSNFKIQQRIWPISDQCSHLIPLKAPANL